MPSEAGQHYWRWMDGLSCRSRHCDIVGATPKRKATKNWVGGVRGVVASSQEMRHEPRSPLHDLVRKVARLAGDPIPVVVPLDQ
jgi:hypothetical protein